MKEHPLTRRNFVKQMAVGLCSVNLFRKALAFSGQEGIPKRPLGKTGVSVSILGLGGHHIGRIKDDQESIRLTRKAIDMGVTFLDNAWCYHDGRSEELMGRALADGYRNKVFLMTKNHGRDKKTALKHLEDSLRRFRTDVIDLWQFHAINNENDPDKIFAKGGSIEAAEEAKKAGKVKFIGFTGHNDPVILLEMLAHGYEWDAVQMPLNIFDAHYKSFQKLIVPILVERNIGVIAMKSMSAGDLLKANVATPDEALRYVWSQPVSTIVSGMESMELLETNVRLAREFKHMSQQEQDELLERTKEAALTGQYERHKRTRR